MLFSEICKKLIGSHIQIATEGEKAHNCTILMADNKINKIESLKLVKLLGTWVSNLWKSIGERVGVECHHEAVSPMFALLSP